MMYILSGKNGRFNSSSRTLFGDRAKRVYVLLVDRQREDENDVDDERDERNEKPVTNDFFIFGARRTLLYRATPSLCPDTNRTLAAARPAPENGAHWRRRERCWCAPHCTPCGGRGECRM